MDERWAPVVQVFVERYGWPGIVVVAAAGILILVVWAIVQIMHSNGKIVDTQTKLLADAVSGLASQAEIMRGLKEELTRGLGAIDTSLKVLVENIRSYDRERTHEMDRILRAIYQGTKQ